MPVLEKGWLSPSVAAIRLGCSTATVKRLADAGRIISRSTMLGRLFDEDDVARIAQERQQRGAQRNGGNEPWH